MHKLWKVKESKTNRLILIKDKIIYKGNPKENDLNRVNSETTDFAFLSAMFSIPYSYIKKIENQTGKKYIKIFYGNSSEEELHVDNEKIKNEIFEFLKSDNEKWKYSTEIPSIIKYAKAQIFALIFLTGIFIWALYLAFEIESGTEYELICGGSPGIVGIILVLANLGSFTLIVGYLILLSIALLALVKRLKCRSETAFLTR